MRGYLCLLKIVSIISIPLTNFKFQFSSSNCLFVEKTSSSSFPYSCNFSLIWFTKASSILLYSSSCVFIIATSRSLFSTYSRSDSTVFLSFSNLIFRIFEDSSNSCSFFSYSISLLLEFSNSYFKEIISASRASQWPSLYFSWLYLTSSIILASSSWALRVSFCWSWFSYFFKISFFLSSF